MAIVDYSQATVREIRVELDRSTRPGVILDTGRPGDPLALEIFAPCDCGVLECTGIAMNYVMSAADSGGVSTVTYAGTDITFTAVRTGGGLFIPDASGIAASVALQAEGSGWWPAPEQIEQSATKYANPAFRAWRERVED
ncbi:hypothetical protein CHO01_31780 [Cellulomonas hominis]|uniref:Uncharacterized protein n=1 Tax=Cellulomonas hominis TaxID=156981 RepID=A0A511FFU9_9CELL|nr:hypothetical protein [Cellulomonas hominis]MBB5474838.1 hypothetical protein [Cellulomonas hominis]NKY05636.1 hypothetical protein [Cellulomonas hominis]GEL48062.1 hypothetical protein CHO01_31780 [Cellulomonas hominis]